MSSVRKRWGGKAGRLTLDGDLQANRRTLPVSFRSQGGVRAIVFTLDYDPQLATLIDVSPRLRVNGSAPRPSLEIIDGEDGGGKATITVHADQALSNT